MAKYVTTNKNLLQNQTKPIDGPQHLKNMCGIVGLWSSRYSSQKELELETIAMREQIVHRGRDGNGLYADIKHGIGFGHQRLSILDLSSAGTQPMQSHCGKLVIVYNGEIYNYAELKKELLELGSHFKTETDTEVALEAYRHWGSNAWKRFKGMFALAIWDLRETKPSLTLVRDRWGIKPLYFFENEDTFAFASECKALLAHKSINAQVSQKALLQYLSYGSVQQPCSIFENIRALEAGQQYILTQGQAPQISFWFSAQESLTNSNLSSRSTDYQTQKREFSQKLEQAVQRHLTADVEVGCFLSGGIDSAGVAALMKKVTGQSPKTFTLGFLDHSTEADECRAAAESARILGCEHKEHKISQEAIPTLFTTFIRSMDQPSIDGFNTWLVSQFTAQEVKVAISGLGGDEIFGGYPFYQNIVSRGHNRIVGSISRIAYHQVPNRFCGRLRFNGLNIAEAIQEFRQYTSWGTLSQQTTLAEGIQQDSPKPIPPRLQTLEPLSQIGLFEINHYLRSTLLTDSDTMSMAHGLELRPLLLDEEIVLSALAMPDSFKAQPGKTKRIFVDILEEIIPPAILRRPKRGFELPFQEWLNNGLQKMFLEHLTTPNAQLLLNKKFLSNLQDRGQRKCFIRADWKWLVILSWMQENAITLEP